MSVYLNAAKLVNDGCRMAVFDIDSISFNKIIIDAESANFVLEADSQDLVIGLLFVHEMHKTGDL